MVPKSLVIRIGAIETIVPMRSGETRVTSPTSSSTGVERVAISSRFAFFFSSVDLEAARMYPKMSSSS
jgi:hypothetical protein